MSWTNQTDVTTRVFKPENRIVEVNGKLEFRDSISQKYNDQNLQLIYAPIKSKVYGRSDAIRGDIAQDPTFAKSGWYGSVFNNPSTDLNAGYNGMRDMYGGSRSKSTGMSNEDRLQKLIAESKGEKYLSDAKPNPPQEYSYIQPNGNRSYINY